MMRALACRVATAVTVLALRMYPPSFRREMGEQMVEDVRRRAGEFEGFLAPVAMAAWIVRLSASLALNAFGAWREARAERPQTPARRDGGAFSWLDVKLGLRMLVKYPGLSLVSVIGMSVAIAIGVGGFGLLNSLVYGELPLLEGDRVVTLRNTDVRTAGSREGHALQDFVLWRDELRSVVDLSAFRTEETSVRGPEDAPVLVPVAHVTASAFRVARVPALLGRELSEEDERRGAESVVVIGYDEWRRQFAEDPDVVGRTVTLGATEHTVVGVMPEGFRFPVNHGYWVPLRLDPTQYEPGGGPEIEVVGRLAEGFTLERAQAELATVSARVAATDPETHEHLRAVVLPYVSAYVGVDSPQRRAFVRSTQLVLSLLLLVVAANVGILVYARTVARIGEIAVRSALGASRRRVVCQLFLEALVLSAIAAALGVAAATYAFGWIRELMRATVSGGLPFWVDISLSPSLVAYTVTMAVAAAVVAGVLPALAATGRAIRRGIQSLSTGGPELRLGRVWTGLIVGQVAITVALLPVSLYMLGPAMARGFAVPDYPFQEFLQGSVTLDEDIASSAEASDGRFRDGVTALVARLESEPEVAGVTFASHFPGREQVAAVEVEGREGRDAVWLNRVDPGLFATFDVPVVAGRALVDADARAGSRAIVVDEAFADDVLGGGPVLGRRIRLSRRGRDGADSETEPAPWLEIVGVVPVFTVPPAFQPSAPKLYRPLALADAGGALRLAIRVRRDTSPSELMGRVREIAEAVTPDLAIDQLATAAAAERERSAGLRLMAMLVAGAMGSVLLLSVAGVYAMMSFIVASRRREIGIRAALGAAPERMLAATFRRATLQLGAGALGGLALAEALTRGATGGSSLLFGAESPYVLPALTLVLTAAGLCAAVGPVRRGLQVPPTEALRAE